MAGMFLEHTLLLKLISHELITVPIEDCRLPPLPQSEATKHCHLEKTRQLHQILCIGKYSALSDSSYYGSAPAAGFSWPQMNILS